MSKLSWALQPRPIEPPSYPRAQTVVGGVECLGLRSAAILPSSTGANACVPWLNVRTAPIGTQPTTKTVATVAYTTHMFGPSRVPTAPSSTKAGAEVADTSLPAARAIVIVVAHDHHCTHALSLSVSLVRRGSKEINERVKGDMDGER